MERVSLPLSLREKLLIHSLFYNIMETGSFVPVHTIKGGQDIVLGVMDDEEMAMYTAWAALDSHAQSMEFFDESVIGSFENHPWLRGISGRLGDHIQLVRNFADYAMGQLLESICASFNWQYEPFMIGFRYPNCIVFSPQPALAGIVLEVEVIEIIPVS